MAEDDEMEMESILHDDTTIDTLSKAEKFYFKYAATNGKNLCNVWTIQNKWCRYTQNWPFVHAEK